jgi:sulfopyruvate decarboxylase subunit beta
LADIRRDEIVVTTMGSAREWPKLSSHELDFHYLPSAMGQAPAIGLGLALARPEREVVVLNGDGCMLMNLGCLVTVAATRAANYTLVVLDNGIYEVTGGQATAAARASTDFAGLARAAGIKTVADFYKLDAWQNDGPALLQRAGPRFICLRVETVGENYQLESLGPMDRRIAAFRAALDRAHDEHVG